MFKKVLLALALGAAASGALAWPNKPVTQTRKFTAD